MKFGRRRPKLSRISNLSCLKIHYWILACSGDEWVHENPDLTLQSGDVVYYWIFIIHDGLGYELTDQSWDVVVNGKYCQQICYFLPLQTAFYHQKPKDIVFFHDYSFHLQTQPQFREQQFLVSFVG